MAWEGAEDTVLSLIRDFTAIMNGDLRVVTYDRVSPERSYGVDRLKTIEQVTHIGDVASYYLPYVETIIEAAPSTRFPCLKRTKNEVVRSFCELLYIDRPLARRLLVLLKKHVFASTVFYSRNHWISRPNTVFQPDFTWDKCFPEINEEYRTVAEYVSHYYDLYYAEAERLAEKYPENLRVFELPELNSNYGREKLLDFCGLEDHGENAMPYENVGGSEKMR